MSKLSGQAGREESKRGEEAEKRQEGQQRQDRQKGEEDQEVSLRQGRPDDV